MCRTHVLSIFDKVYRWYPAKRAYRHAYAWQIGPFWQDIPSASVTTISILPHSTTDPTLVLPMDKIQAPILLGSIPGVVTGGATVAVGKLGGALHLNGVNQNVNFGPYNPVCLHTYEMCPDGITWAMWLKLEGNSHAVILDTGGYYSSSVGYCLLRRRDGVFRVLYSNVTHYHALDLTFWDLGQWVHLVFVLDHSTGASMYLNGCRVDGMALIFSVGPRSHPITRYMPFVLGSSSVSTRYSAMGVDNLLIWYDVRTPEEVWQLYLQGGEIWLPKTPTGQL